MKILKIKSPMTERNAGKKQEGKEKSSSQFTLYDTCNKCPLWVYIELVCNNNLNALIITGDAPESILKEVKCNILIEFSELSGGEHAGTVNNVLKSIYNYRSQIDCLYICIGLLETNRSDKAIAWLKSKGITVPDGDIEKLVAKVTGIIKSKMIYLNKETDKYKNLVSDTDRRKVDASFYNDQLVALSIHFKFNIDMNITLAQYASYLKIFSESINRNNKSAN
ncbi:hypothetical protein IR083_20805 [Dysgonomonas sp. GY75]|uniref:hypothetical protein n=1 Tax=Dysgonomonas sp. GY75 TaxID=2780419 RepID=UPI001883C850|nr:hypothetical protein [Dysgonomonas sp. GY75]MBF0651262.1 hypothetical protein [Dysgonomonas sp. GY75]